MKTARFAVVALLAGSLALGSAAAPVHAQVQEPVVAEPAPTGVPDAEPAPGPAETAPAPAVTDALQPAPTATAGPSEAPDSGDAVEEPGSAASDEPAPDAEGEAGFDPVGPGHVVPGPDAPLETEADGSVHSLGEDHDLPAGAAAAGPLSALPFSAASRTGTIQVTLVLSTLADNRSWVNEAAARAAVNEANRYWREMSNGRLGISIKTVRRHDSQARSWEDYAQVMNTVSREIGWRESPYTALVAFTPAADLKVGGYGGFLGGGWTSTGTGGRILMPAPSGFTSNVVTHEFGHTLGLLHANSLQCTNGRSDVGASGSRWNDGACSSREYADTLDLMGYAQLNRLPVINSYFWDAGGFGRGNEILNAGDAVKSRSFTLKPWGGTAAQRAVKFRDPLSGETYYVELRQPAGYDSYLASGPAGNRGVKITKADRANSWATNSLSIQPSTRPYSALYGERQAWQVGQTFTTHTGLKIRVDWMNQGGAGITVTGAYPDDWSYRAFTPGDFNGDRIADLVTRRTDGTLWFSAGTGSGTFRPAVRIGQGWQIFNLLVGPGDYDGDGRNDILARNVDGSLWLYSGTGKVGGANEGYKPGRRIGSGGWNDFNRIIALGDADGDRRADLLATRADGGAFLYSGTGNGGHGPSRYLGGGWNRYTQLVGAGDFNGNGRGDLIGRTGDGKIRLLPGQGNGTWGTGLIIGQGWNIYQEIHGGFDFNRDGRPDLIGRYADQTLAFYAGTRNVSEGYRAPVRSSTPGLGQTRQVISVGDFNGDKRPDLLSVRTDGSLWLHPGQGSGRHGNPVRIGSGWQIYAELTSPGDFNGDGRPDLVARAHDGTLWFYAGTGKVGAKDEGYRPAVRIGAGWEIFRQVLGTPDLDGDRRPDIVARHRDGSLWFYSGTGRIGTGNEGYRPGRKIGTGGWETLELTAPGDYDRNGTGDLLARAGDGTLFLYRGTGKAGLQEAEVVGSYWNTYRYLLGTGDPAKAPDLLGVGPDGATWHYTGTGMAAQGYQAARSAGRL